jgi:hypothetical protein
MAMVNQSNFLRTAQIFFAGVVLSPALFLGVIIYLQSGDQDVPTDYGHPLVYAAAIIITVMITASYLIYKFQLPGIRQKEGVDQRLHAWRINFIIRIAMVEAAALFCCVCLLLTGFDIFLYMAVAVIVYQLIHLPTKPVLQNDLNLSEEELSGLQ